MRPSEPNLSQLLAAHRRRLLHHKRPQQHKELLPAVVGSIDTYKSMLSQRSSRDQSRGWRDLPEDVLILILKKLGMSHNSIWPLLNSSLVSKSWHEAVQQHTAIIHMDLRAGRDLSPLCNAFPGLKEICLILPSDSVDLSPLASCTVLKTVGFSSTAAKCTVLHDFSALPFSVRSICLCDCYGDLRFPNSDLERCVTRLDCRMRREAANFDVGGLLMTLPALTDLCLQGPGNRTQLLEELGGGNLGNLPALTTLQLLNFECGDHPKRNKCPTNLRVLALHGMFVTCAWLESFISFLPALASLELHECDVGETMYDCTISLPNILRVVQSHDKQPCMLGGVSYPGLRSLTWSPGVYDGDMMQDSDLSPLAGMTCLTKLKLSNIHTWWNDEALQSLSLLELVIEDCSCLGWNLKWPGSLQSLTRLVIQGRGEPDLQFPDSFKYCHSPAAETMRMRTIADSAALKFPRLRQLELNGAIFSLR